MAYNTGKFMELLLNLTWLSLSVSLGVLLLASRSRCKAMFGKCAYTRSTAWISYGILVALLLPAISMTDDLMAMVAPSDGEQIMRRYEASATAYHHHAVIDAVFHNGRDGSAVPLVCTGRLETLPAFRLFAHPPVRQTPGRAPPAAA